MDDNIITTLSIVIGFILLGSFLLIKPKSQRK